MFNTNPQHFSQKELGKIPVKNPEVHESRLVDRALLNYPLTDNPLIHELVAFFSTKL